MEYPKISVNIPLITGGSAKKVIKSLTKVKYPFNKVEVVIIEGNQIAKQRNIAIKHSTGDIVYLLDDDSEVHPDSFRILAEEFKDQNVAAVGGPSLPKKNSSFYSELIGYALETYFGAMRMRLRYSNQLREIGDEYHLIGANLALRKKYVTKVGMFNEQIVPNEETELLRRLKKARYGLLYLNNLSIIRTHRSSVLGLAKQFYHYGIGRMKQIKYNGNKSDLIFFIPVGFALYISSLFFFRPNFYLVPLLFYLIFSYLTSLKAAFKYKKLDIFFSLPLVFFVIHVSYAIGIANEFLNIILLRKNLNRQEFKTKITVTSLNKLLRQS